MLQNPRSELAAWSKMHKDVLAASHFEGDFGHYFISFPDFFYDRICFSIEIPFQNVQVVTQVVNNKKVMAKTPREANLYGNWCVRKGLIIFFLFERSWKNIKKMTPLLCACAVMITLEMQK